MHAQTNTPIRVSIFYPHTAVFTQISHSIPQHNTDLNKLLRFFRACVCVRLYKRRRESRSFCSVPETRVRVSVAYAHMFVSASCRVCQDAVNGFNVCVCVKSRFTSSTPRKRVSSVFRTYNNWITYQRTLTLLRRHVVSRQSAQSIYIHRCTFRLARPVMNWFMSSRNSFNDAGGQPRLSSWVSVKFSTRARNTQLYMYTLSTVMALRVPCERVWDPHALISSLSIRGLQFDNDTFRIRLSQTTNPNTRRFTINICLKYVWMCAFTNTQQSLLQMCTMECFIRAFVCCGRVVSDHDHRNSRKTKNKRFKICDALEHERRSRDVHFCKLNNATVWITSTSAAHRIEEM